MIEMRWFIVILLIIICCNTCSTATAFSNCKNNLQEEISNIDSPDVRLYRLCVISGWVVTSIYTGRGGVAVTFVPDPEHNWEIKKDGQK